MARRKAAIYRDNPFLTAAMETTRFGWRNRIIAQSGDKMLVDNATGEIEGTRTLVHREYLERNNFVKLYVDGIAAILSLGSAGKKVFAIICEELYGAKGVGQLEVALKYDLLQDEQKKKIKTTTFYNGINECIEAGIIAQSMITSIFHINPNYIFNGNRLAVLNLYLCKDTPKKEEIVNAALIPEVLPKGYVLTKKEEL